MGPGATGNDVTARDAMWRRIRGDDWAAFDALPPAVGRRLSEHAYDAWAVNVLVLWRSFRRKRASSARAVVTLLRYLDQLEDMERKAFVASYRQVYGDLLPHDGAAASVLRHDGSNGRIAVASRGQTRPPISEPPLGRLRIHTSRALTVKQLRAGLLIGREMPGHAPGLTGQLLRNPGAEG